MTRLRDQFLADVRYAVSSARRSKGFVVTAVVTIALGIGLATAMMSAAYGILIRPLPYPESDRLVQLWEEHPGAPPNPSYPPVANTTFYAWRTRLSSLESLGLFGPRDFTVTFPNESLRVHGGEVSPAIFEMLRVSPQLGRFFIAADDVPGHHDFVVLSDRLWRQSFSASRAIVGQAITVDGRPHIVVGVARAGFAFPDDDALMWTPFDDPTLVDPKTQGGVWLGNALGRMRAGATVAEVRAEGTAEARSIPRPPVIDLLIGKGGPVEMQAKTLIAQRTDTVRPAMLVLVAGVAIVLLVGCANVANLLLARGLARERELMLRTALGASRARVIRQLLTESLVLAGAGGALGFLIAAGLLRSAVSLAGASVPRLGDTSVDVVTGAIATALSIAVAAIAGLVPALRSSVIDLSGALRGADGAVGEGFRHRRAQMLRRLLLSSETALAVLLIVGAGLLARSFVNLANVDPGYSADGVLTVRAYAPEDAAPERIGQFMSAMTSRLEQSPGVIAAGAGNMMPFNESTSIASFDIPASVGNGRTTRTRVAYYIVTPGYAKALGLRLRAGRWLEAADVSAAVQHVVVNDEFVREYLNPDRVVGTQLPPRRAGVPPMEIVGVVAAQRKAGNDQPVLAEMYVAAPAAPRIGTELNLIVKTSGDPASLGPSVRQLAREVDPTFVIGETLTLERRLADSWRQPKLAAAVLASLAGIALLLAAVGVYGVLSYSVSQRARELAVRSALGAGRRSLLMMILSEGLAITVVGGTIGLAIAALATRLMSALLFGVAPLDPMSFLIAPLALVPVALAACVIPAVAAVRTNAAVLLRQ